MKKILTKTGCIFYDEEQKLEFLYVGDYGKKENIKADFLGYTKEINSVKHKQVDLGEKLVVTISTQKGCPMKCNFCDVHKFGYYGNASIYELNNQIMTAIKESGCTKTNRLNIHFARMGEPTFNNAVIDLTTMYINNMLREHIEYDVWHPVISTMLPKNNKNLKKFILEWCHIKNLKLNGEAGLQFSINSTDDEQRNTQFKNMSLDLESISKLSKELPKPTGRKYTLNFAITKDTIIDVDKLSKLFDKEKFIVKLTPIHETKSAIENDYEISGYDDYNVYRKFEKPLVENGWDVIVFVPSREEDNDRITCGNALISKIKEVTNE